ncbi:hypothetical protein BH09DEP1_BH09DEP1_2290 [soil metagenome]
MIKSLGILLLALVIPACGAAILQSCHTHDATNLADYIIEDYDPTTEVSKSICLSSKDSSLQSSQSSQTKESVEFVEQSFKASILSPQQNLQPK